MRRFLPGEAGLESHALRRLTVHELFQAGLRRAGGQPLPMAGPLCRLAEGMFIRFSLRVKDDRIEAVAFKASTCVTLVAYCERLAKLVTGLGLADAIEITDADLVAALPGVHPAKRDRAAMAIEAFRAAVQAAAVNSHGGLSP